MTTPPISGPGSTPRPELPESRIPPGFESWEKMFARTGQQVTPQQMQQIMSGILRFMTVIINQQTEAMKRASQEIRKSIEGNQ